MRSPLRMGPDGPDSEAFNAVVAHLLAEFGHMAPTEKTLGVPCPPLGIAFEVTEEIESTSTMFYEHSLPPGRYVVDDVYGLGDDEVGMRLRKHRGTRKLFMICGL